MGETGTGTSRNIKDRLGGISVLTKDILDRTDAFLNQPSPVSEIKDAPLSPGVEGFMIIVNTLEEDLNSLRDNINMMLNKLG